MALNPKNDIKQNENDLHNEILCIHIEIAEEGSVGKVFFYCWLQSVPSLGSKGVGETNYMFCVIKGMTDVAISVLIKFL